MRHDWILEVLSDLRSYALRNGLPDLAERVDQTLRAARIELGRASADDDDDEGADGGGPERKPPSGERRN